MKYATTVLVLLLCSCAAAPQRDRWQRERIEVCWEQPMPALDVWALPGVPRLVHGVDGDPSCAVRIVSAAPDVAPDVALTRTIGSDGEIRLATILLSDAAKFGDATAFEQPPVYDLQSVLTHELGHVLGLPDSIDRRSAMFHEIAPGEVRRRITYADAAALMEIYE